ncbi:MAG: hypothetical protein AAF573_17610 [Bacteroidota bacterium]
MNITDVNNDGIGMDGMDVVAHYEGAPLRGNADFSFTIGDVTYYFSTKENMEKFEAEPAKYLPIAGGYPVETQVSPPEIQVVNGQVVGGRNITYQRALEDTPVSIENNVPMDIKEDGSVEMQNLSDSEN